MNVLSTGQMFDRIAPSYDIINHILSLGLDIRWRNRLAGMVDKQQNLRMLDLATGTGDLLIAVLRKNPGIIEAVGLDISQHMLNLCREKIAQNGFANRIKLVLADAAEENLTTGGFDLVTMGFGIRNTPDVLKTLRRINSLLKTGGTALILEFAMPKSHIIGSCYRFYLRNFIPFLGGLLSRQSVAYRYLANSIESFYRPGSFCDLMQKAGFDNITVTPLTFGVACIYNATAATGGTYPAKA
jgi:demethylmenaquinone methyltransferase / 2-methoxy-6-polyprenyl-1,4-benzoquinol methylase